MARAANSPVFGASAEDLKQSANKWRHSGPLRPVRQLGKNFLLCKVSKSNNEFCGSANVPFHLFPRKSVNHVMNQSKQQTLSFIVCLCRWGLGVGFGEGFPKLFLAIYPFSISIDEHVPLKFLMTKRLRKITKLYLSIRV